MRPDETVENGVDIVVGGGEIEILLAERARVVVEGCLGEATVAEAVCAAVAHDAQTSATLSA